MAGIARADRNVDVLVIGAGPAGLGAAIAAASRGCGVLVADENSLPGGQLFKQIHKFFGSREHRAGTRGFRIGEQLLEEARRLGVEVMLDSLVWGLFPDNLAGIRCRGRSISIRAEQIIVASGASENALAFPGSTLPGVMTAGAAQTLCNVQRVLPGERVLMVGTGNVGLIVSYQLMQAGAEVLAVVEAAERIGGYDVHANKLRRAGVPMYLSHTVLRAEGRESVERAVIAELDDNRLPVPGTEKELPADTICLAVGLSPRISLLLNAGCRLDHVGCFGGHVPLHDAKMMIRPGLYAAGDVSGIEEASTALEEGRLAGTAAAEALGRPAPGPGGYDGEFAAIRGRLDRLRSGRFGEQRRLSKEGIVNACGGGYTF